MFRKKQVVSDNTIYRIVMVKGCVRIVDVCNGKTALNKIVRLKRMQGYELVKVQTIGKRN